MLKLVSAIKVASCTILATVYFLGLVSLHFSIELFYMRVSKYT